MYNSSQKKKTVARPEGLPLPWGSQAETVHVHGGEAYKGPLNWFPDRCCRMEGLELAASPSFLQTTCAERRGVRAGPPHARLLACACVPEPLGEGGELRPHRAWKHSGQVFACPSSWPHLPS